MADNFKHVINVIEELWACDSARSVFDIADSYGKSLGFDVTLIASTGRMLVEADSLPPLLSNMPAQWGKKYVELDFYTIDPITQMAGRSCRPFTFEDAYFDPTPKVKMFMKEAAAHGLEFGWSVPVHTSGLVPGVVTYAGRRKVDLNSAEQLSLFMVSMLAYQRAGEFFKQLIPDTQTMLTDRERAVLTLVARGKTNWEVGTVLSISEYSVRDYLKTLAVKLQTSNRTHSVARAMQLGLIVP